MQWVNTLTFLILVYAQWYESQNKANEVIHQNQKGEVKSRRHVKIMFFIINEIKPEINIKIKIKILP